MRRSSRDRFVLRLLGALTLISGCSRLTAVDWALIPAGSSAGAGSGAADSGGAGAGESAAGAPPERGGEDGVGGEATAGEGGAGDVGGSANPFGGSAGFGGRGGAGHGGVAGVAGGGGMSGNAGTGGSSGGTTVGPTPCTGTVTTVQPTDLVLFDGGPGTNGDRGGRTGLDQVCKTALAKLSLPQTKTHAFTSVTGDDCIATMPQTFPDIKTVAGPMPPRVVGPTGIQVAKSFAALIGGQIDQSLVCAAVVPMNVDTWLSGSSSNCASLNQQTGEQACGQFGSKIGTCDSWSLGTDDELIQGIYGSTRFTVTIPLLSWLSWLKASCDAVTDNVICLAYTPSQP